MNFTEVKEKVEVRSVSHSTFRNGKPGLYSGKDEKVTLTVTV